MRTVIVGGRPMAIRATVPALMDYRKQFGTDLVADLIRVHGPGETLNTEGLTILQMIWVMAQAEAKANKVNLPWPTFEAWLESLECVDFSVTLVAPVLAEAAQGFFRQAGPKPKPGDGGGAEPAPDGPRVAGGR